MKNPIIFCAALLLCLSLALPARATLEGDPIDGSATGLTTFNTGTETVVFDFDPEFGGTLDLFGDGSVNFNTSFFIFGDDLTIFIEHDISGSTQYMSDFTVTFSDLDYVGFPTYVLSDVISNYDTLGGGAGLSVSFTDDSLELSFANFEIPESRELQLGLVFEEDGPVTPIPEPASLTLLALGACGLALKRKYS